MKRCSDCQENHPTDKFGVNKAMKDGLQNICKACRKIRYKADPSPWIKQGWKKQGIQMTLEAYDSMWEAQGGVCAICGLTESSGRRLSVDHDHGTGETRGLLCTSCNTALGSFKDDPSLLAKAIVYLTERK